MAGKADPNFTRRAVLQALRIGSFFALLLIFATPVQAEDRICAAIREASWLGPYVPFSRSPHVASHDNIQLPEQWTAPSSVEVPNFGFAEDNFLFKLEFSCPDLVGKDLYLVVDYPNLDHLRIWDTTLKGPPQLIVGDQYPFDQRPLQYADFVIPIHVKEHNTLYLQLQTSGSVIFPLRLWNPIEYGTYYASKVLLLGISVGIALIMAIYNVSIFFSVRDRSYLFLSFWIFLFSLYQMAMFGLTFQFLWPSSPYWANHSIPLLICISTCSACLFGTSFLNTKQSNRLAHVILLGLAAVLFVIAMLSFVFSYSSVIRVAAALVFVTIFGLAATGIIGIFQRSRSAFYFTFAWIFLLLGILIFTAKSAGIAPSNNFTNYSMNFGSALEIILLSFALGDKINTMQRREKAATENLLHTSLSNEQLIREKNDALAVLNNELEKKLVTIEENRKTIAEKAEQIEIETKARFMLVSDLAHKMNNSLTYLQTAQISMQSTLDIHHDDVLKIFAGQDSEDEEVVKLSQHLEDQLLGLQSHLTMVRMGLDRSTQTMREIRTLSGVDGYAVVPVNFYSILEQRIKTINTKLGYSGTQRLICEHEELKDLKTLSNDIVLGLAFDLILHLWRLDTQADYRICVDPYLLAQTEEEGIVMRFLGEFPKVSEEDKSLFSQLKHLVRPYSLTLEWKDQYRMIIFLFRKEHFAGQAVA